MRLTNVCPPSSTVDDRAVSAMSWHRRRIRRARRHHRESGPPPAPTAQAPSTGGAPIRRIVVFVPRTPRAPRSLTPVTAPGG
jgi:hypothetical protein